MKTRTMRGLGPIVMIGFSLWCVAGLWAQTSGNSTGTTASTNTTTSTKTTTSTSTMPPEVIDENSLFGGSKDIVTVIDESTASAGTVQLVEDTKTYPVFLMSGTAGAGLYGSYTPVGSSPSDPQALYGAVNLSGLRIDYLPTKNIHFSISGDLLTVPDDIIAASVTTFADLRHSELVRLYMAGSFDYDPSADLSTYSLDELFVDTHIDEKVFFRLGKQRIRWGVGYWYQPSDVLSLSAIDPDDPTAARAGPFAFKVDMPMNLNHLMVYMVPPVSGSAASSSIASKYDWIVNGWELSFGGYGRADMLARPRAIFSFTGAIGSFDVYGENVLFYGSDRIYVKESSTSLGPYETYRRETTPFFQSTLGIKYSAGYSSGLSYSFHAQGYYNGTGYADSSIMQNPSAIAAIKADYPDTYNGSVSAAGAGMWYLAGSASVSGRFGEGRDLTQVTGSVYALSNFSDRSLRFNPMLNVAIGDQGGRTTVTLSCLTAIGNMGSEYAPKGNMTTPALSFGALNDAIELEVSAPISLNSDFSVNKVQTAFSVFWNAVQFD